MELFHVTVTLLALDALLVIPQHCSLYPILSADYMGVIGHFYHYNASDFVKLKEWNHSGKKTSIPCSLFDVTLFHLVKMTIIARISCGVYSFFWWLTV